MLIRTFFLTAAFVAVTAAAAAAGQVTINVPVSVGGITFSKSGQVACDAFPMGFASAADFHAKEGNSAPYHDSIGTASVPFSLRDMTGRGEWSYAGRLTLNVLSSDPKPIQGYYCAIEMLDSSGKVIPPASYAHSGTFEVAGSLSQAPNKLLQSTH